MLARPLAVHAALSPAAETLDLGALPEWRLDHLYPGMESAEFAADLARASEDAKAFASARKGRLADLLSQGGEMLARTDTGIRDAAGPDGPADVLRLTGLRGRHHRRRTSEILRRRFGEGHRHRRRATVLRTGVEPARRCRTRRRDGFGAARPLPTLAGGHPQGEATPTRRRNRAAFPRKIRNGRRRLEQVVRRDHRVAALRDRRRIADFGADAGAHVRFGRRQARSRRPGAGEDVRRQSARVHPGHEHARQGQGDFRPLAKVRRHRRLAPSRQPRRARSGGGAGRRR